MYPRPPPPNAPPPTATTATEVTPVGATQDYVPGEVNAAQVTGTAGVAPLLAALNAP